MKVCLVQFDIAWHQPIQNLDKLSGLLAKADSDVDVVVLPEMFTTGFSMQSEMLAETKHGNSIAWMIEQSNRLSSDIVGSLITDTMQGMFTNRLWWIAEGDVVGFYDKRHLFAKAGEDAYYQAGSSHTLITKGKLRFMPLICYDLRFPVWSRNSMGYDVLLYVANWPAVRRDAWRQLLIARAIENQSYVIGVNRVGRDGKGLDYAGDSMVVDPYGTVVADQGNKEGVMHVSLEKAIIENCREQLPFLRDQDAFELLD